ncbi:MULTISPECIES: LysR family transcriptional regulator [unclassified Roseivivax]|uniref:LysR family transcriptional regulator n=1 Tax=Roseivivax sp. GX 12232 TaxID=2900547 RepID=UPI001E4C74DA|nr:LysR family transcriptional regulator [Roseivivax sp. GX 12232]MCE0506558.1 LysR family transcriptional regulator [Roseivivax sp. GX 12232]
MNLRQLEYFIAIAEEGSVSAASQKLNVAQPSLSQQIKKLEDSLGVQLLERSSRGVTLTEAGLLALDRAELILQTVERARSDIRQMGSDPAGGVSFGLPSSVSMVLSVPLAETVRAELPLVRLRAVEAMSGFIQTWLADQEVDLGMLYDVSGVRHLTYRAIVSEELHFFSAPDAWPFRSRAGAPVPMADLAKVDLVLPSKTHGLRALIDRVTRAHGVHLDVVTEMDALSQIKTLVSRGSGYTVLAPAAALDRVERGELLMAPIVDPAISRSVYLVHNPAKPQTRAAQAVEEVTMEVVRDLVRRGIWRAEQIDP